MSLPIFVLNRFLAPAFATGALERPTEAVSFLLALLYGPSDISCGQVYEFNIYRLMEVDDPQGLFPINVYEVS